MDCDWKEYTLDELCLKITDGSHQSPKAYEGGSPMFSVKDMTEFGFSYTGVKRISEIDYVKLVKQGCRPEINDILIAKDGSVMKHVFKVESDIEGVLLSSIAIIRPNLKKVDPDFLVWSLLNPAVKEDILNNYVSGSGVPRIVLKDFKKIVLKVPENLNDQKETVKILCSLSKKIDYNTQTNQTLESIAQAVFKSWFVDFDPVKAKIATLESGGSPEDAELAAMRAISSKSLDELAELKQSKPKNYEKLTQTSALFPSAMQESELGPIPLGWEVNSMEDLVDIGSAKRIFAKEYIEEGVPFYRGKEITELSNGKNIKPEIFISKERYEQLKEVSGAPKENDILITSVGTIGNTYLVKSDDKFYFKDGNLTWIRSYKKEEMQFFLKTWFDNVEGKRAIENIKIGSTQQAITIAAINKLELVVPPTNVHNTFHQLVKPNFMRRNENLKEIETLAKIRDSLLPRLLCGEREVK